MREVVDGVMEIPIGHVKAFAVIVNDGVVLVDTGLPGRADKVAMPSRSPSDGSVRCTCWGHWHPVRRLAWPACVAVALGRGGPC